MIKLSGINISDRVEEAIDILRRRLNREQISAAESILENPILDDGFLLPITDGPAGTGKTTVGVYASLRCIQEEIVDQILYVAPTNFACERAKRAFESLGISPSDVIRITPTERRKDWTRGIIGTRWDLSDLTPNELRRLKSAPILICTPYMLGRIRRGRLRSSRVKVIIDEFSQIDPALFFSIISYIGAERDRYPRGGYALLGDRLQLPVVTTQEELLENVVDFIMNYHTIDGLNELTIQYRMHREICEAVNRLRAELNPQASLLRPDSSVRNRDLEKLGYRWDESKIRTGNCFSRDDLIEILDPSHTLVIINTDALPNAQDEVRTATGSVRNSAEAEAIADIFSAVYQSYIKSDGSHLVPVVVTPYNAQVNEIRMRCRNLEIPNFSRECVITAYRAQGHEYPLVILSLVRRNPERRIGFLEDEKLRAQIYVGCSRAQAKLIVFMSRETFGGRPLYDRLIETSNSRHSLLWGWD